MTTVYDTIIENIETERSPWCRGTYEDVPYTDMDDNDGDWTKPRQADPNVPISRCLVGHVRFALGTEYVTVNKRGVVKVHTTKNKAKLNRQAEVLGHLSVLIGGKRSPGTAEDHVIGWNDGDEPTSPKTKRAVVSLLRRASKKYPEDVAV